METRMVLPSGLNLMPVQSHSFSMDSWKVLNGPLSNDLEGEEGEVRRDCRLGIDSRPLNSTVSNSSVLCGF